jgi:hypothetical protein
MDINLAFSMGLLPCQSVRFHPENLVRRVLEDNMTALVESITAGSLTVAIASNGHGIEMLNATSGIVRFVIGGRIDILEKAHFSLDWGNRILELHVIQES